MTTTTPEVAREIAVPLPIERTFALFTERMHDFNPPEHSIGDSPVAAVVIEPWSGGRWFERGEDGTECPWGRVRAWDPPRHVGLVWQISAAWAYDPDLETFVDVDFETVDDATTRVRLRHHGLEAYGDQADAMLEVYARPDAWEGTLRALSAVAATG